jgi:hypothetical protein
MLSPMPCDYLVDHSRRRIVLTPRDPVSVTDVVAAVERQATDGTWAWATLIDSRLRTSAPTAAAIRQLLARVRALSDVQGPRGPVAMVASMPAMYGMARMYATLGESVTNMQVFGDLAEAEQWLDSHQRSEPA